MIIIIIIQYGDGWMRAVDVFLVVVCCSRSLFAKKNLNKYPPPHNVHLAIHFVFDSLWRIHGAAAVMKAICDDDGNETDMLANILITHPL